MIADLVKETTSTTGTGSVLVLTGAVDGFRSFADAVAANDLVDGCTVSVAVADGGTYTTRRCTYDQTAGTLTCEIVSGEEQDLSGSAIVSITRLAKDMDESFVELAVVDYAVTPDLAKGLNFRVSPVDEPLIRVNLPDNSQPGQRFSITFDGGQSGVVEVPFAGGYEAAPLDGEPPIAMYLGAGERACIDCLVQGDGLVAILARSKVVQARGAPTGRYVQLAIFPAEDLGSPYFKEVKFSVGGSPIPANMTANTDGGTSIYYSPTYEEFNQTGDVYHATDGNTGTAFGDFSEDWFGYVLGFDFGESKALEGVTVTPAFSGGIYVVVAVSDDSLIAASNANASAIYGYVSATAGTPFTVLK